MKPIINYVFFVVVEYENFHLDAHNTVQILLMLWLRVNRVLSCEIEMDVKARKTNVCFNNLNLCHNNFDKTIQELLEEIDGSNSNNCIQLSFCRLPEVPIGSVHTDRLLLY